MPRKNIPAFFALFVLLSALCVPVFADTGKLLVRVTSETNRPLENSKISVESRTGEQHHAVTDANGKAEIGALPPGLCRVTAKLEGYVSAEEPDIRVVRGKTVPVDLVLRPSRREDMEEILVVADELRGDKHGGVGASYVDREYLRTATGSGADVMRALDGLPGLLSTGEFANFTVRGRGPRDNLILVDGFPYDKVVHFDDSLGEQEDISGGGRFSIFAPNLIEGAEFSPGGWSAAYGGRNGSLLKLDVARGNPSPTASVRLDLAGLELVYDGPSGLHEGTSVIATYRHFDFGRIFDLIGENDLGSPVMTDLILKTHTQIDPFNTLEFLLLHNPEQSERTVENVLFSENLEDRELLYTRQDSTLLGVTWTRLFGYDGIWENRFYYRDSKKTSREGEAFPFSEPMLMPASQVPAREDIFTLNEAETEIGFRSDVSVGNRWGLLNAGIRVVNLDLAFSTVLNGDWIRYEYDSRDFQSDPLARYILLTPDDTGSELVRQERQISVYGEQLFEWDRWDVRAGLRYENDGFSGRSYLSPRLSANYQLSRNTRFALTAGTFYQSPRFLERAADPDNAGLRSERLDHFSLGIERRLGESGNVLVEAYFRRLDDLVTDVDAVTGDSSNSAQGTAFGVDVVFNRRLAENFWANAVYSYNDAKRDDRDGLGRYPPDYNHKHIFSVGGRWEITNNWQAGFRWKYATGRPRDEWVVHDDVLAPIGGPLRYSQEFVTNNTARWDAFHTLNVRIDYRRPVGAVDLIGFLDILNLYGGSSSDELEFNPATGLVVSDDEEDPFPLIGIRFEKTW